MTHGGRTHARAPPSRSAPLSTRHLPPTDLMSQQPGIAIIDSNCLHRIVDPLLRDRVRSSLATAGFEVYPSVINAIEAAQAYPSALRNDLLGVVASLAEGKGLLPQVGDMLKRSGEALAAGETGFWSGRSGLEEALLDEPGLVTDEQAEELAQFMKMKESRFNEMHERARPKVRSFVKGKQGFEALIDAVAFIDQIWMTPSQQGDLLADLWSHLGLKGNAPVDALLAHPIWKAWLELEGIAVFERAISLEQPKRVDQNDLLLAVNLSLGPRRLLISDDRALRRAAGIVFVGRYPQSRVVSWAEFEKIL